MYILDHVGVLGSNLGKGMCFFREWRTKLEPYCLLQHVTIKVVRLNNFWNKTLLNWTELNSAGFYYVYVSQEIKEHYFIANQSLVYLSQAGFEPESKKCLVSQEIKQLHFTANQSLVYLSRVGFEPGSKPWSYITWWLIPLGHPAGFNHWLAQGEIKISNRGFHQKNEADEFSVNSFECPCCSLIANITFVSRKWTSLVFKSFLNFGQTANTFLFNFICFCFVFESQFLCLWKTFKVKFYNIVKNFNITFKCCL